MQFFRVADAHCQRRGRAPLARPRVPKTPFGDHALRIGRALHTIEGRTTRLAKLAGKSSLFDDPAAEISEISTAVREELAAVANGLDGARLSSGRQSASSSVGADGEDEDDGYVPFVG